MLDIKRLIKKKNGKLNGCSFLVQKSIVLDAGFTFSEDYTYKSQLKDIKKWKHGCNIPNWNKVPDNFHLIISHAHEDHFCGIFSIPLNKSYNLYITQVSYEIIKKKIKYYNLKYKQPDNIYFINNESNINIDHNSLKFIEIHHNIPGNIGIYIENANGKYFYVPDYNENFWKKLELSSKQNLIITDFYPDLSECIKGNCNFTEIKNFINNNDLPVLVDYGWDWEKITQIIQLSGLNKKISMSPYIYKNFPKNIHVEKTKKPKPGYLYVCDLEDFQKVSSKKMAVISNHYLLSLNPLKYIKSKKYLNIFVGGHMSGKYLKKFLNKNKTIKTLTINYH